MKFDVSQGRRERTGRKSEEALPNVLIFFFLYRCFSPFVIASLDGSGSLRKEMNGEKKDDGGQVCRLVVERFEDEGERVALGGGNVLRRYRMMNLRSLGAPSKLSLIDYLIRAGFLFPLFTFFLFFPYFPIFCSRSFFFLFNFFLRGCSKRKINCFWIRR